MKKTVKTMVVAATLTLVYFITALTRDSNNRSPINLGRCIPSSNQVTWSQEDSQWTCILNNTEELLKNRRLAVYEKNGKYTTAELYHFDENGITQTGWLDDQGQTSYLKPDGRVVQGEYVGTTDEQNYVSGYQNFMLKNRNITIDGKNYNTGENGRMISNIVDKTLENPSPSGQSDQLTYLNTYHRQKDVSDLFYDSDLAGVVKAAYDYGSGITSSKMYPLAPATGRNVRHAAPIRATVADRESYVYLTEDVVATIQNTRFTRVEYHKSSGTVMTVITACNQEEASILSADGAQGRWINDNGHYKYRKTDGSYATNCWVKNPDDGKWYHFDEDSCMQAGWSQDSDGKWYYLSIDTGEMLIGTTAGEYVIGGNGVMVGGS